MVNPIWRLTPLGESQAGFSFWKEKKQFPSYFSHYYSIHTSRSFSSHSVIYSRGQCLYLTRNSHVTSYSYLCSKQATEQLSIERLKPKTIVIVTNQLRQRLLAGNLLEVRLKASDRVEVDVRFASDWLRWWREFFLDQSRSEVKQNPMHFRYSTKNVSNLKQLMSN